MGEAFLKNKNGLDIKGIINEYYVYANENISAGDFVEFIQGVKSSTTATSTNTLIKSNYDYTLDAFVLSDTRVLVFYSTGINQGYYLSALFLDINGATISITGDTILSTAEDSGDEFKAIQIDTNKYFIAHNYQYSTGTNYLNGMIVNLNGTTLTVAADKRIQSKSFANYFLGVHKLSTGNIFIIHGYENSSEKRYRYGCVLSISGTTLSVGTDTMITDIDPGYSVHDTYSELLSGDRVFVTYYEDGDATNSYAKICTINNKTISMGSQTLVVAGKDTIRGLLIEDNKILLTYTNSNQSLVNGIFCNVDTSSITCGTEFIIKSEVYGFGIHHSHIKLDDNKFLLLYSKYDKDVYKECLGGCFFRVDNNVLTSYPDVILDSTNYSAIAMNDTILINKDKVLSFGGQSNSGNWHARILSLDHIQNKPSSTVIVSSTYETQVRKATSTNVNGISKTGGTGGTFIGHNAAIKVYTPIL